MSAFFEGTKWTQNLCAGDQIRFWGLGRQTWWLSTIYQTKYWSHSIILVDLELLAHTWRDGDLLCRNTKLSPQLHEPFWGLINYEANLLSGYLQVGHWPVVVNCSDRDQVLKGRLLRGRPFQITFCLVLSFASSLWLPELRCKMIEEEIVSFGQSCRKS